MARPANITLLQKRGKEQIESFIFQSTLVQEK